MASLAERMYDDSSYYIRVSVRRQMPSELNAARAYCD